MSHQSPTTLSSYPLAVLTLILAMSLAGSSVVVGKILISELPVYLGTFLTLLVALFCMIPLMHRRLHELRRLTAAEWKYLLLQGLCGIVLFRIFTLYGLHTASAVQAGIITGSTPAVLAALSFFLLGEKLNLRAMAGIGCAVAGCVMISVFHNGLQGQNSLFGSLLVGLAVICEALFTIFRKRVAASVSATTNTTVLIFCSLLMLSPPAIYEAVKLQYTFSINGLIAVLYYGVFATVIAYLLWTSAVGKVNGAVAGTATAAMPASSVILAAVILKEEILWQHAAGCVFIIAGIILATTGKQEGLTFSKKNRWKRQTTFCASAASEEL